MTGLTALTHVEMLDGTGRAVRAKDDAILVQRCQRIAAIGAIADSHGPADAKRAFTTSPATR
jgi:hypothetical protein